MNTEEILARLTGHYASRFMNQYNGVSADVITSAWNKACATLLPRDIEYAFEHLPKNPVNAAEFRALALQRPSEPVWRAQPSLPPVSGPEVVAKFVTEIRGFKIGHDDPKEWARVLARREAAGDSLTIVQRDLWRRAFGLQSGAQIPIELRDAS
jgi:hypothetical protein